LDYRELFSSQEFRELLNEYERAEQQGYTPLLSSDDYTDIAEYYHYKGDFDRALQTIDQAIGVYPGALGPLVFRARAALMREENAEKALYYADQIEDKSDLDYYYIMAEILIAQYQPYKANDYLLEKLDDVDDDDQQDYILDVATMFADYEYWDLADSWMRSYDDHDIPDYQELLGRLCIARGDYDRAEQIFNALLDGNAFSTCYWSLLGLAQLFNEKVSESIQSCDYALALNPNDSESLLTKANALYKLGNLEETVSCYARYMKSCGRELPDDFDINEYISKN
jgi:tetratricopeptide (TPR) repeat protein